jgi:hypothetical protein
MAEVQVREEAVQVTVDYLPATHPFHQAFPEDTRLEVVRTHAMGFFGVQDRQERDTYRYFLEFDKNRITDTNQTLGQLLGPHRQGAHFHLIEEITAGSAA